MVKIQKICCFQLGYYILIWGWLGTICSGLGFVLGIVSSMNIRFIAHALDDYSSQFRAQLYVGIFTFFMFVSILTSIGLILSVLRENHKLMIPWLIHEVFGIFVEILQISLLIFICFTLGLSPASRRYVPINDFDEEHSFVAVTREGLLAFLIMILVLKVGFNAFRIYVFIGAWSLFKIYRQKYWESFGTTVEYHQSSEEV